MSLDLLPSGLRENYEVHEWRHACAILYGDFPSEWQDIIDLLTQFRVCKSWIDVGGGRKSKVAQAVDDFLNKRAWTEKQFTTAIEVDSERLSAPTHKVDCYKNRIALETEWNNKDPFFDRDLNNFRLLFDLRAISVGIIITRADSMQSIFNQLGRGHSYGASTTHMTKLLPRIAGGSGGGCPILVFGITPKLYEEDC